MDEWFDRKNNPNLVITIEGNKIPDSFDEGWNKDGLEVIFTD